MFVLDEYFIWGFLCFPEKDYENAIKFYSEALDLNPSNAIYYSNRSLAYLRTECYGYALADATKALEVDKNYIKGYYRRATSNMALGKFKAALKDYETVSGAANGWMVRRDQDPRLIKMVNIKSSGKELFED